MTKREMQLLLKKVDVAIDVIKIANLKVIDEKRTDWRTQRSYNEPVISFDYGRAELDRVMLNLQKDLGKLRKELYKR